MTQKLAMAVDRSGRACGAQKTRHDQGVGGDMEVACFSMGVVLSGLLSIITANTPVKAGTEVLVQPTA
jgi:hypothetical protein